MSGRGSRGEPKQIWDEARLKAITRSLVREGLYRPETESMLPRQLQVVIASLQPFPRTLDPELQIEKQTALDRIFRDNCAERAKIIPSRHPSLLHDGTGSYIMRRSPTSLRESIARDLVENGTLDEFSTKYRLSALLISRGIRDKETVDDLSFDSSVTFKEFESCQAKFEKQVSSAKRHFFAANTKVTRATSQDIWQKFDSVWKTLSVKQRSALQIHIMDANPMSLEEGAKRLKISKAAFKDRVKSGIHKIMKALPELSPLKELVPVTATTNLKQKRFVRRKNAPTKAELDAWIEQSSPEPLFSEHIN